MQVPAMPQIAISVIATNQSKLRRRGCKSHLNQMSLCPHNPHNHQTAPLSHTRHLKRIWTSPVGTIKPKVPPKRPYYEVVLRQDHVSTGRGENHKSGIASDRHFVLFRGPCAVAVKCAGGSHSMGPQGKVRIVWGGGYVMGGRGEDAPFWGESLPPRSVSLHVHSSTGLGSLRGNPCTACALRATFRLCSPQRAPRHAPWKHLRIRRPKLDWRGP